MPITKVHARQVLDSRGKPTVEVEVHASTATGQIVTGRAIVPSGASTGLHEACELRDGDAAHYEGQGVLHACRHVCEVFGPALVGLDPADQIGMDQRLCELDGTPNKSRLGANAILGISLATAHAAAAVKQQRLDQHLADVWQAFARSQGVTAPTGPSIPLPMVNMISGGLHAGGQLDYQDFLAIPVGAANYSQALEWIVRIYRQLGKLLVHAGYEGVLVGDEGGYGPRLPDVTSACEFVVRAIEAAGLQPGRDVGLALDVASSHFYVDGNYQVRLPDPTTYSRAEMVDALVRLVDQFPILSIEDGVAEDDWEGWRLLTQQLGSRAQLIGDDLFVTNRTRLQQGIAAGVANSVLVKVNQIGTLTETFQTILTAQQAGYTTVISARSGETEDATMADLAVATGAGQIKIGSVARSERLAKYNQLLRLEEALGTTAAWTGKTPFTHWLS